MIGNEISKNPVIGKEMAVSEIPDKLSRIQFIKKLVKLFDKLSKFHNFQELVMKFVLIEREREP